MKPISLVEVPAETIQWSGADIEFPSTSTSDEIEIIFQPEEALSANLTSLELIDNARPSSIEQNAQQDVTVTNLEINKVSDGMLVEK